MAAGGQGGQPATGHGPLYKTDMCWNFQSGKCWNGDACTWAHSESELRERPAWATDLGAGYAKAKGKGTAQEQEEAAVAEAHDAPELGPQEDFAWSKQESEPARLETYGAAARNVLLGEEVAEKLRYLNSEVQLHSPIDINAVVAPLSQLDPETALEILDGLHERGHAVDDPTAWICEAAGAIPPAEKSWADEDCGADAPGADDGAAEAEVVEEIADDEDEVDPALLGIEVPISAAKRRRTDAGREAEDLDKEQAGKGLPQQPQQPPPSGVRPPALGKGWVQPAAAGAQGQWRPSRYKTDICTRWRMQGGYCPAGPSCTFAHGPDELRPYPAASMGLAPIRPLAASLRPAVAAGMVPPRVITPPVSLRTVLCVHFQRGQCAAGEACRFAHSEQQARLARLQQKLDAGGAPAPQDSAWKARPALPGMLADTTVREGQELTMDQICNYKTRLCVKFALGRCSAGENCLLAHGQDELQQPWDAPNEEEADDGLEDDEEGPAEEEEGPAEEQPEPGEASVAA